MSIKKDRRKTLVNLIKKQMSKGIRAGLELEEANLKDKYNLAQSPPTSNVGDYPHRDSGQLLDNISSGMQAGDEVVGGVGVKGRNTDRPFRGNRRVPENIGGLHAYYLANSGGRKGIDDSFLEDASQIAAEIEVGAQS